MAKRRRTTQKKAKTRKRRATRRRAAPARKKRAAPRKRARARRGPRPIPAGFHTVTPHLTVSDGNRAIDFYKRAFGAKEIARMPGPGGMLMHGELKIGNSIVMLAGEMPGGGKAPTSLGGSPVTISLYVNDADAVYNQAVSAGARPTMPVADQFWGDRYGQLQDPFGHIWAVATHKEDLTPDEMGKRAAAFFSQQAPEGPGAA